MEPGLSPKVGYFRQNVLLIFLFLVFLERVFQECLTYEGEMDYKTYLDFVLAIENKRNRFIAYIKKT